MSNTLNDLSSEREQICDLFKKRSPVLVEVRFPKMGTSSDWYLIEDSDEFEAVWQKLTRGVEVHARSVWDVPMTTAISMVR